jgi:hypothetical protein
MKPKAPLSDADREFLDFCYVGLVTWHWRRKGQDFDIDDLEACMKSMPDGYLIEQIEKIDVMRHPDTNESHALQMLEQGGFAFLNDFLDDEPDDETTVLIYPDCWIDAITEAA